MPEQELVNQAAIDLPDGFKMTELGPLPNEWQVVRAREVASIETELKKLEQAILEKAF